MEIYMVREKESHRLIGIFHVERIEELIDIIDGEIESPINMEAVSLRNVKVWCKHEDQETYMGDWTSLRIMTQKYEKNFLENCRNKD